MHFKFKTWKTVQGVTISTKGLTQITFYNKNNGSYISKRGTKNIDPNQTIRRIAKFNKDRNTNKNRKNKGRYRYHKFNKF